MKLKQDQRLLRFHGPGRLPLVPVRLVAEESLSALFQVEVELASERSDVDHERLLGLAACVEIDLGDGTSRFWHGHATRFDRISSVDQGYRYRVELRPWLWFLEQTQDSRVFQDQSARDILEALFGELGFPDFEFRLADPTRSRGYCVQYQESTFAFVSRLLEDEGLHYFFEHQRDRHVLVITDAATPHKTIEGPAARYHRHAGAVDSSAAVRQWTHRRAVRTGRWALDDYDFERPGSDLGVVARTVAEAGPNAQLERFEFPGGFVQRATGEERARQRMEAEEAQFERILGAGNHASFVTGTVFTLQDHPVAAYNASYLLCAVRHDVSANVDGESDRYDNEFECVTAAVPYRPLLRTPVPRARGLHSAVVTGPPGEEIHTDRYGRVRVKFHWDHRGKADDRSSCWVRVAQPLAGKGWGFVTTPRVGQEVVVDFLYGDPDRPVVVGALYNAVQRTPYALPSEAAVSGLKTNSSKGGEGFNEMRFDDRKGSELLFMHAERDHELRVKNDQKTTVKGEAHSVVEKDRFEQVAGDQHTTVAGLWALSVQQDANLKVGGAIAAAAGTTVSMKAGTQLVIEAGQQITLKAGSSTIVLGPAGVTIDGSMVKLNSGGSGGSAQSPITARKPSQARQGKSGESSSAEHKAMAREMKQAAARGSPFLRVR